MTEVPNDTRAIRKLSTWLENALSVEVVVLKCPSSRA
jgi:hypothetical protein